MRIELTTIDGEKIILDPLEMINLTWLPDGNCVLQTSKKRFTLPRSEYEKVYDAMNADR